MRKATREIHAISDSLVNAKLAFALSDNSVWAEGLLIFYEIFRFLEGAMVRLKDTCVGQLSIDGMQRTEAFEKDLAFYLGPDWNKNYIPRESVVKYLLHLQTLEKEDPTRLIAYIYHLYMGLLSGGQILRRKRALAKKFSVFSTKDADTGGAAVTDFGEKRIFELKRKLVDAVNDVAKKLDENTKQNLIMEGKVVFELNNSIVKTVKGTSEVILRKLIVYAMIVVILMIFYFSIF
ncbi:heme oxygenase isoform X2 [Lycorma delicatula]